MQVQCWFLWVNLTEVVNCSCTLRQNSVQEKIFICTPELIKWTLNILTNYRHLLILHHHTYHHYPHHHGYTINISVFLTINHCFWTQEKYQVYNCNNLKLMLTRNFSANSFSNLQLLNSYIAGVLQLEVNHFSWCCLLLSVTSHQCERLLKTLHVHFSIIQN